jgi:signal transduction histidine kinase
MQFLATSVTIRGMSLIRGGIRSVAWWVTAGLGVAVLALNIEGEIELGAADGSTLFYLAWMAIWTAIGLFVWALRPDLRLTGPLWAWSGVLHLNENLLVAMPDSRFVVTEVLLLLGLAAIVQLHWTLAYPAGLVYRRLAVGFLLVIYIGNFPLNMPYLLIHPASYFYNPDLSFDITTYNRAIVIFWLVPIGVFVVLFFADRLRTVSPAARRSVGPLMIAGLIQAPIWTLSVSQDLWGSDLEVEQNTVILVTFGVFGVLGLSGLFFVKRARGNVGDLVVELNRVKPGRVREALARAVGDPTLEVGLWLPDRQAWVDEQGEPLHLPPDEGRHATYIGERLAVVVHDHDLVDQPALLEAAGSAARLALENARLQAELRAQLVELSESRARIVRAGDEERRRLERDLHDGAQQRLLALGMGLQLLHRHVDPSVEELLAESEHELQQALRELRELAHGIHPAALTDNGLGDAVRTLAQRAPVPVTVEIDKRMGRLPGHVETAAYFVVAEALTNIAKYANASEAWITVDRRNGNAHIEIRDNGNGGATPDDGTGLKGLTDRVGALDGHLTIESPPGHGTRVIAEIPCSS